MPDSPDSPSPPDSPGPRRLWSPLFVFCLIVLVAGALGLRVGAAAMARQFMKESIDLRRSLKSFEPAELAGYRRVPKEMNIQTTVYDLGTEEWFMLPVIEADAGRSETDLIFFVTYYSNPRDQVPHTPETCYRQAVLVTSLTDIKLPTPGLGPDTPEVDARLLHLDNNGLHQVLVYAFCCNGDYYSDRQEVRWRIGLPGEKYTYFSKAEAVTEVPDGVDPEAQITRIKKLLAEGLALMKSDYYPLAADLKR